MNATNTIFEALTEYADSNSPPLIASADLQADGYTEITAFTVRVKDVFGSELEPSFGANGATVKEVNAVLDIEIYKRPVSQVLADRLEARDQADAAAQEIAAFLHSHNFGACFLIGRIFKRNDWVNPGGVKTPVSVLRVNVNPQR